MIFLPLSTIVNLQILTVHVSFSKIGDCVLLLYLLYSSTTQVKGTHDNTPIIILAKYQNFCNNGRKYYKPQEHEPLLRQMNNILNNVRIRRKSRSWIETGIMI